MALYMYQAICTAESAALSEAILRAVKHRKSVITP